VVFEIGEHKAAAGYGHQVHDRPGEAEATGLVGHACGAENLTP
jgi:hypothetical protein